MTKFDLIGIFIQKNVGKNQMIISLEFKDISEIISQYLWQWIMKKLFNIKLIFKHLIINFFLAL